MIIKEEIYIGPFEDYRTLHIYIPDDLKEGERCPVIYMFDGHNLFYDEDATYGTSWGLKDIFDAYGLHVIIVGLECNHEGNKRLEEFSPYNIVDHRFGAVFGRGQELFSWMVSDLKSYIDEHYPTLKDREHTSIGGSSMGGLMALYGIIRHNDVYAKAIVVSPYIHRVIKDILRDIKKYPLAEDTKIYLSYGSKEPRDMRSLITYTDQVMQIQRAIGRSADLYLHIFRGHGHDEGSWRAEVKYWLKDLGYHQYGRSR